MKKFSAIVLAYWPMILGVIVLIVIIKPIKGFVNNTFGSLNDGLFGESGEDVLANKQQSDIDKLSSNKALPRPDLFYSNWATTMYNAMQGTQVGNRFTEQEIRELQGMTAEELKRIVKNFGIKKKKTLDGWLLAGIPEAWQSGDDLDLIGWFKDELNEGEMNIMRNIFSKTGLW